MWRMSCGNLGDHLAGRAVADIRVPGMVDRRPANSPSSGGSFPGIWKTAEQLAVVRTLACLETRKIGRFLPAPLGRRAGTIGGAQAEGVECKERTGSSGQRC